MTGWGRQGPCLSQHGSVWLSPHSLPWQCQESETRAQSVSRPRMSGSLEGLHCAWCTKSRLLFCRHELEPGPKAPRSLLPRPCLAAAGERRGLPLCRTLVGHVPRTVWRGPIRRGKHLFSDSKTPSNSIRLLFPPAFPISPVAKQHQGINPTSVWLYSHFHLSSLENLFLHKALLGKDLSCKQFFPLSVGLSFKQYSLAG